VIHLASRLLHVDEKKKVDSFKGIHAMKETRQIETLWEVFPYLSLYVKDTFDIICPHVFIKFN
jgi:hypothetical protein